RRDEGGAASHGAARSRVGRLLARTSLAGLPQLWNVLRGDLSLVGPRPERPGAVQQLTQRHPEYAARLRMPPGLTGLAQVHARRGGTSTEDRVRLDNLYIDSWSLWQDLRLVLRTAGSLFRLGGR
ncbi:sugar transferase, partial [Streptomyces lydicus]